MVSLSLEEIEEILGFDLSASASKPGWWVNATAVKARAQTWSWIDAGYEASMQHGLVTFRRGTPTRSSRLDRQSPRAAG